MQQLTEKYKNIEYLSNKSYREFHNFNTKVTGEIRDLIRGANKPKFKQMQAFKSKPFSQLWALLIVSIPLLTLVLYSQI